MKILLSYIVFVSVGVYSLFAATLEFSANGISGGFYHDLMMSSIMFYAASDIKRLSQGFISYIKTEQPASYITLTFQLISGILFVLWITN